MVRARRVRAMNRRGQNDDSELAIGNERRVVKYLCVSDGFRKLFKVIP